MDDILVYPFIELLRTYSAELNSLISFIFCTGFILVFLRMFGKSGLYVYNCLALIAANIQVLKISPFLTLPQPVALGTVTFVSTFIVTDLLTEHYGPKAARNAVWLGLIAQVFFIGIMMLTLGHPLYDDAFHPDLTNSAQAIEKSLEALFTPSFRIFIAGICAYLLSQFLDIYIFSWIKNKTKDRYLWLRSTGSTLISNFIDNAVFGALAWIYFNPNPIDWNTLWWTYILGTYMLRAVLSFLATPVLYLSFYCLPKSFQSQKNQDFS